ncbi:hypothetical protein, partial [Mesobacillus boroniphilus]|uniref:hypothetical protein n=1 Tax=Mesobacillus boroniphilus TaxID=308892 RepID=UPI0004CEB16E
MRKLLKGLLVFCLSIGIVSVAPQGSNAKTTISDPAKEKATELKSQGLDVQVTEVDGYTIVSGFDSTDLKNAKASKGKGDFVF